MDELSITFPMANAKTNTIRSLRILRSPLFFYVLVERTRRRRYDLFVFQKTFLLRIFLLACIFMLGFRSIYLLLHIDRTMHVFYFLRRPLVREIKPVNLNETKCSTNFYFLHCFRLFITVAEWAGNVLFSRSMGHWCFIIFLYC